ncbi:hypothetical protein ACOSQ2_019902 [Xanthoceras sorbifolium]
MLTARVYSVEEAYQLALQLERQTNGSHQRRYQPTEFVSTRTISTSNQKKSKLVGEGLQCYKCKGFGHFAVVCPTKDKRVAYVCEKELIIEEEAEPISIHNIQETQELEADEVLQATNLSICVINRVLTGRKQLLEPKSNDWKRTNIFHTRVAHGNRAWINDVNTVPVQFRCLVKFSLGLNYADEIWCDIFSMTVCHLLLGRPWLYDRRVTYNGFENSYSFLFQRRKITLEPLPIADFGSITENKSLKTNNTVLTLHQICREIQIGTTFYDYAAYANLKRRDVQFAKGDQVMVRLRPERFSPRSFTKLHPRRVGPFSVLKKLGSNAYVIDLPREYTFSPIFNVEDLIAFKCMNEYEQGAAVSSPRIPYTPPSSDTVDAILDHQFVSTRQAVWLQAVEIQRLNPELFHSYTKQNLPESSRSTYRVAILIHVHGIKLGIRSQVSMQTMLINGNVVYKKFGLFNFLFFWYEYIKDKIYSLFLINYYFLIFRI